MSNVSNSVTLSGSGSSGDYTYYSGTSTVPSTIQGYVSNNQGVIYCAPQTTTQEPQMSYDCKFGGDSLRDVSPDICLNNNGTVVLHNLTSTSTSTGANTMDSGSVMELGIAAILFAIAAAIVVGTRIFWLKEVGQATYTPIKPKK